MKILFLILASLCIKDNYSSYSLEWSDWQTSECFSGVQYRTKKIPDGDKDEYEYQLKNTYADNIIVDCGVEGCSLVVDKCICDRVPIKPNSLSQVMASYNIAKGSVLKICIENLVFGKQDSKNYFKCDRRDKL